MNFDVYTIAHEVKNPLSIIKGYSSMLNEKNLERYKVIIDQEINTAISVLDSYLEYNKIVINKEIMDLNVLFQDVYMELKDYLSSFKVTIDIDLSMEEVFIEGDYDKLKQVLLNIIKNSMEAKSTLIDLYYEIKSNKTIIYIKDNGYGINHHNLDKIGQESLTNKVMGHGIGVMFSRRIIEMHGGNINYSSQLNYGTIVTITL